MLQIGVSLTRPETGWLAQRPDLAKRLRPIAGLVSAADIRAIKDDWAGACTTMYKHALARSKEIERVARVHRDPFEPILVVLEAASPLAEYKKIADEILRFMPDEHRYPLSAAEAVRSYLLIRLGLHSGLRQKNLRQLQVCPRGGTPPSERSLVETRRGELRWNDQDGGWEIFIPAVAFKNATSSFFSNSPFRLMLPDLHGLYGFIDSYLERHIPRLLRRARDPGAFFVKTVKSSSKDAAYDQNTFYEAWRLTIQRYGIHNPYTGRGALPGLLPHGPHNVRDVLATHILKQTGSYEQASYAIQDTPDVVAKHYGRFLPRDKASLAAQILNQVWAA
jgi:integrase